MKKVVILHGGWQGDVSKIEEFLPDSKQNWMGWTKAELEKLDYKVTNPFIRFAHELDYEGWKKEIEGLDLEIDKDTTLVGWSMGGAFWARWLGETRTEIDKLILVAPSKIPHTPKKDEPADANPYFKEFIDFDIEPGISRRARGVFVVISNDCDCCAIPSVEAYKEALDAKVVKIANQGHFTNAERPGPEFPELLEIITHGN